MAVIGSYKVEKQIAEGAFGRTFLGKHRHLGFPVCIKQNKSQESQHVDMFREEARVLWPLRHSSLPALMDYMELKEHGQVMVLSFIEGEDLQTLVEQGGPIDDEHICWILDRLLGSLSYLHHHGVIHCDIKPANIILDTPVHNATLVDFGMAAMGPDAYSKAKGGTPFYIPPEFALGYPPIPESDIYSAGMTAVFMAGGNVASGQAPLDMPGPLRDLLNRMIRRDAKARPDNTDDIMAELRVIREKVWGRPTTQEEFKRRGP